jgi:hypothetical protein
MLAVNFPLIAAIETTSSVCCNLFVRFVYNLLGYNLVNDRLCGQEDRVPGYRCRGPGSIPSAIRFSER